MLNYERRNTTTSSFPSRIAGYLYSNFRSSIGKLDYELWNKEELYPLGIEIGLDDFDPVTLQRAYEAGSVPNQGKNWTCFIRWFDRYSLNYRNLYCSTSIYSGGTFCQHWRSYFDRVFGEVDRAIADFYNTSTGDATNYAFHIRAANNADIITDINEFLNLRFSTFPYQSVNCILSTDMSRTPERTVANCNLSDLYDETSYAPPIPHGNQ